ncbi:AI-2E family transporter [Natronolimnobius baerhuensis]|uniref:AI-2E family transporter n=1 Tax=Natronolimnobius baerhuensis TaxID=253108 RepID=A0A202E6Y6_9EURY|nr:AI-2E family transporter [Natronolimnobius baerhuensis]OVE84023.1 AI-2E family transporter [Natronolimnobius baerhuensis]
MNRSRGYLLVLIALFAYFSWQLVTPFFQYVLAAVLLAFVLTPLQRRLEAYISPTLAAFSLLILALLGFIIPFVIVAAVIADDAAAMLESADPEDLEVAAIEDWIADETGFDVDIVGSLVDSAEQIGSVLLEQTTAWFSVFTHALLGLGLALFLLYYLLKDGDVLLEWLHERTPLPDDVQDDLYSELNDVMWAVLAGHVMIAVVQGLIAGLGLFATGIPNATFWTFVMIILALIPLIGAFLVWGPAVAYLFVSGEPILAIALLVYSAVVVGVSDDYLRPIVVDRYAELSPGIIILGVLGGIYAFGVMGLFFGPVLLGALVTTLEVYDEHYERLGTHDENVEQS